MEDKNTYTKRVWLNSNNSASTGSVVAFHGKTTYGDSDERLSTFLEVADCHCKISLHKIKADQMSDFIRKMRLLAETANNFADFLENVEEIDA